jgi:hypothetical protein
LILDFDGQHFFVHLGDFDLEVVDKFLKIQQHFQRGLILFQNRICLESCGSWNTNHRDRHYRWMTTIFTRDDDVDLTENISIYFLRLFFVFRFLFVFFTLRLVFRFVLDFCFDPPPISDRFGAEGTGGGSRMNLIISL